MKSKKRSAEYYKTADGQMKKMRQNACRNGAVAAPSSPTESEFKESVVEYTRLLISMTEHRKVSRDEAVAELRRVVSQRSLDTT